MQKIKNYATIGLLALLLLNLMMVFTPTAAAAAAAVDVELDYPYATVDTAVERTITVENPAGNPGITSITVSIPDDAAQAVADPQPAQSAGFLGTITKGVAGTGPYAIMVESSADVMLPGGAAAKFDIGFTTAAEEDEEGVIDEYTITVSVEFATDEVANYMFTIQEGMATTVTLTVDPDLDPLNTAKAGEVVDVDLALDVADEGLTLELSHDIDLPDDHEDEWSPEMVTTDADGEAATTFMSTYVELYTLTADVADPDAMSIGGLLAAVTDTLDVIPEDPTKVQVYTEYDPDAEETINYLVDLTVDVWASVTDKYGNPVVMDVAADVEFTVTKGDWELDDNEAVIAIGEDSSILDLVALEPYEDYGTWALISAKVDVPAPSQWEGDYSGNSPQLMTSCFATAFTIDLDSDDDDGGTLDLEVMAGEYAEIVVELDVEQENVPVTFEITADPEDYENGSFSPVTATTDAGGEAETMFYVSTVLDEETTVTVSVSKPLTDDDENVIEDVSGNIITISADPAALVVESYEDIGLTVEKDIVATGENLYLLVSLVDAYENVAVNTFDADIQVDLSVDYGSTSVTTALIWTGDSETVGYDILYTAPSAPGTANVMVTSPQAGLDADSVELTVAGPEPVVRITDPAEDGTVTATETVETYVTGYAEPSPAQPDGTVIAFFMYSLNGADNVTVPIVEFDAEEDQFFFNFTVAWTVNATHTLDVYAIDSEEYEGMATRVITVEYGVPAPTYVAVISDAMTLDSAGNETSTFGLGETVLVSATVTNDGSASQAMLIAVQLKDPDGRVLAPSYITVTLAAGQSLSPSLGFTLPTSGYRSGEWTAKIMVLDTWPAMGGVVIGEPVEATMTVTA
jgi:hypothetical protein